MMKNKRCRKVEQYKVTVSLLRHPGPPESDYCKLEGYLTCIWYLESATFPTAY